ncbi:MAG: glycine cleavage system aminomethyltransferase GcvT [Vicinamibacterales bacterium]
MTSSAESDLKRTPLYDQHVALKARMVPFGGWHMPVEYSGITDEHIAVRTKAGLFDVSHMGEFEIAGRDALAAIQLVSSNDASKLKVGQIQYSALMTEQGTFVDDLLVYRLGDEHFFLVVNASNIDKDFQYIRSQIAGFADAPIVNVSQRYALIAMQGPSAAAILQSQTAIELSAMKYYWFAHGEVAGIRGMVSRTGYTGEDGFEIAVAPAMAGQLWNALLAAGQPSGLVPAGLGARDTLRLEASMRLYGNDMDETTTVLEADLGWVVGWNKPGFLGIDVLKHQKASGTARKLVGFEMQDRGIARHGYAIQVDGRPVGSVTSGTQTPFLKKAIGMGYVPIEHAAPGTTIAIDVRGRAVPATVVPMPFYKRPRS